jgi:hypothetical protein
LDSFETRSTDPYVNALLAFGVVGVAITSTLLVGLLPLREAVPMVTNACKAEHAVIVGPILAIAIPPLPNERGVTPESCLVLPRLPE